MFVDLNDTQVITHKNSSNKDEIKIIRLAGSEKVTGIRLDNLVGDVKDFLYISFNWTQGNWFIHFFTPQRTILKGSTIDLYFDDHTTLLSTYVGAIKSGTLWSTLAMLPGNEFIKLEKTPLKKIIVSNRSKNYTATYTFMQNEHGFTPLQSADLVRLVCRLLLKEYNSNAATISDSTPYISRQNNSLTDGPILNRQYNVNTKYGRRKAREQAAYNYEHGSEKYRKDIDEIGCAVWAVIIFICLIIFVIIWNVSGPDAAIKWLK